METPSPGFDITLLSHPRHASEIIYKINWSGAFNRLLYINDEPVPKRSLMSDVYGVYTKDFSTNLFTARLSLRTNRQCYTAKRPVAYIYAIGHCGRVIEILSALNLKSLTVNDHSKR